jgi:hypothetical protein
MYRNKIKSKQGNRDDTLSSDTINAIELETFCYKTDNANYEYTLHKNERSFIIHQIRCIYTAKFCEDAINECGIPAELQLELHLQPEFSDGEFFFGTGNSQNPVRILLENFPAKRFALKFLCREIPFYIARGAFARDPRLASVDFSSCTALRSLGQECFYECENIESVNLAGCISLKCIDSLAFGNCFSLRKVSVQDCESLTMLDCACFKNCLELTYIDLSGSKNLKHVEDYAFFGCKNLQYASFSNCARLETVSSVCFFHCHSLVQINMSNCKSITEISSSDPNIGDALFRENCFHGCDNLKAIHCLDSDINKMDPRFLENYFIIVHTSDPQYVPPDYLLANSFLHPARASVCDAYDKMMIVSQDLKKIKNEYKKQLAVNMQLQNSVQEMRAKNDAVCGNLVVCKSECKILKDRLDNSSANFNDIQQVLFDTNNELHQKCNEIYSINNKYERETEYYQNIINQQNQEINQLKKMLSSQTANKADGDADGYADGGGDLVQQNASDKENIKRLCCENRHLSKTNMELILSFNAHRDKYRCRESASFYFQKFMCIFRTLFPN